MSENKRRELISQFDFPEASPLQIYLSRGAAEDSIANILCLLPTDSAEVSTCGYLHYELYNLPPDCLESLFIALLSGLGKDQKFYNTNIKQEIHGTPDSDFPYSVEKLIYGRDYLFFSFFTITWNSSNGIFHFEILGQDAEKHREFYEHVISYALKAIF